MPDLSNLVVRPPSRLPALRPCDMSVASSSSLPPAEDLAGDPEALYCKLSKRLRYPISTRGTCSAIKREKRKAEGKGGSLADHVRAWVERKVSEGVEERECQLPFLTGAPKMVECHLCTRYVYPGEEVLCSVRDCREAYHITCAKQRMWKHSTKEFKCPRHDLNAHGEMSGSSNIFLGKQFLTDVEAYNFYNSYARNRGFGVRRKGIDKSRRSQLSSSAAYWQSVPQYTTTPCIYCQKRIE